MYFEIAEPLLSTFVEIAFHFTTKLWFCGSTETNVGEIETPLGIVNPETDDSGPGPAPFEAETLIVYFDPLVNPRIQQLVAVEGAEQENTFELKVAVATYPVMSDPPEDAGADHETRT